ncbi:restriction endonuclease [Dapis sp. BLCC M172]|uniref:restriction endonuclease n=1 Tax=Dapis sp. BLCC M172 TaxID=2975281 RepID=UPI003CF3EF70
MSEIAQATKPIQKILFGSPGTGKSYKVREIANNSLQIQWNEQTKSLENTIKTVFHPEYTYSDFLGKLLPQTTAGGSVIYKFYPGHFIQVLGLAYKYLIDGSNQNVLLVIDELNRGNAAAIFGPIFQLLDREVDNWSTYDVNLSELEIVALLRAMGYDAQTTDKKIQVDDSAFNVFYNNTKRDLKMNNQDGLRVLENLKTQRISIPRNLSIIATINTSDESIYYLDSAFKRRWDWEYVDVPGYGNEKTKDIAIEGREEKWLDFVNKLNDFIKVNHQVIRRIEDKQIGVWFLKCENNLVTKESIENKLMFYLWDSVFPRDRRPLENLLSKGDRQSIKLITYSDFVALSDDFIDGIISCQWLNF